MNREALKHELEFLSSKYGDVKIDDLGYPINGNFWIAIADMMRQYHEAQKPSDDEIEKESFKHCNRISEQELFIASAKWARDFKR